MAGTVVQTHTKRGPIGLITLTCTADASDASFPDTALVTKFSGELIRMVTNPGGTGPTNLYDIALDDADGIDVLYGAGDNLLIATTEEKWLAAHSTAANKGYLQNPVISVEDVLTWKITNNSVNSAVVVAKLYYRGQSDG